MTTSNTPRRTTQKLIPSFRSRRHRVALPGHYEHMFHGDLHLGIMPFRRRPSVTGSSIDLTTDPPEAADLIASGLPSEHGRAGEPEDAVNHFIRSAAQLLAWHGRAIYEIVYEYDADDKPASFHLVRISDESVHNARLFWWQRMEADESTPHPEDDVAHRPAWRRFRWAPRRRMLVVEFPPELGGRRAVMRINRDLSIAGAASMSDLVVAEMRNPSAKSGYDFALHHSRAEMLVARATRGLGWPMRGAADKAMLEYYQLYRYLKFEKTKVIIRDHIVDALNDAVRRIGVVLGFTANISLKGVRTRSECEEAMRGLQSGELQISKAWDWLFDRKTASQE
jgi:hypothetical protein